jgi:integration host factor subunit beta
MTRSELAKKVRERNPQLSLEKVDRALSLIVDDVVRAVDAGERVELRGFGSFFSRERKSRMGRNPKTEESLAVPAKRVMFFKAGKNLLERLNGNEKGRK